MKKKAKVISHRTGEEIPANPLDRPINIPTKEVEALLNAVAGCQWNAVSDIVQNIREVAQEQLPEVFPR